MSILLPRYLGIDAHQRTLHAQDAFGRALQPLRHLRRLFLGIYLSDADVLCGHLTRCASAFNIESPRTGSMHAGPPFGPEACMTCQTQHRTATRARERLGGARLAALLPALETIGWASYFADEPESGRA